ncbi:MAG TPA: ferredoxin--NADP reductase [Myxococcota bacterium]|nr:ferredoxin--NADP reductase [Myxococcota bacterium]
MSTPDPKHAFHTLRIAAVVQETPDTRSFAFEVPPALAELFRYVPGQFLTFEVPFQGMRLHRCYSLSSAPECDSLPQVTVKRVERGRVSNWFNDQLANGSTIDVKPPEGLFVLRRGEAERPLVMFGGGSGITPILSLLKSALVSTRRSVKLVYANRDRDSIIFRDELERWRARYPDRLSVHHHLDAERGFMHAQNVKDAFAGLEHADFYICGPGPFMDIVEGSLEERRVGADGHVFIERFVSPTDPDRASGEAAATPAAGSAVTHFSCTLDKQRHEIPTQPGESLLAAARRAGLEPSFSCEEGYCGSCMAQLRRGKVQMRVHDALTAKDLAKGWILACQARLEGDEPVEIDFDARY